VARKRRRAVASRSLSFSSASTARSASSRNGPARDRLPRAPARGADRGRDEQHRDDLHEQVIGQGLHAAPRTSSPGSTRVAIPPAILPGVIAPPPERMSHDELTDYDGFSAAGDAIRVAARLFPRWPAATRTALLHDPVSPRPAIHPW
jgi:hypothetical protein